MADAVGRALSRTPRDVARTARHLRTCPGRSRSAGSSDGPGAAVSRRAFVARSDPAHDFHRRNAGSARVRGASFSALDLPTVRIGVHSPRSCPGPSSYLVHRCRITMPALWRTTHPCSSPNQSGPAEYHRRWRALRNSCQGPRQARLRIRNRAAGWRGHACDEGAGGSRTNGQAGSLYRPQSWTPAVRPRSRAPTPVATRRDAETAATHAWIPVLAAA